METISVLVVHMKTLTEGTAVAPFPKVFSVKRARAERSNASSEPQHHRIYKKSNELTWFIFPFHDKWESSLCHSYSSQLA